MVETKWPLSFHRTAAAVNRSASPTQQILNPVPDHIVAWTWNLSYYRSQSSNERSFPFLGPDSLGTTQRG